MVKLTESVENVYSLFAQQVVTQPDAVAVIDESVRLTYRELAERADGVAACLHLQGLEPEQAVGVLMNRRADLLAVLLGIWKAGGAYVPFDPGEPFDRLQRMQASCDSTLLMGDHDLLEGFAQHLKAGAVKAPRMLAMDTIPFERVNALPQPPPSQNARLAYLLFTSGSTGEPKAVEVEHAQVLALLASACGLLEFDAKDRYLASSTIAFDASITELFLPLVTGASLLLRSRLILMEPKRLAREVLEHGITVLQTSPAVWQVLLAEVADFPKVRVAITHGEAVTPEFARRLASQGETVWNLYGPTETTVWACGKRLQADDPDGLSASSAPIGYPLPHVLVHVLDENGEAVADGQAGELCLGGPSVTRGYRKSPELTRARFVSINGERLYRSGDMVIRDADGMLHYLGRNDDQIKVRGVRIEPGEIEAAMQQHPQIAQAAATWFTTQSGTRAIVAAVVLKAGAACTAMNLRQALATRLPGMMIPALYLFVPSIPMTTSGKTDRSAIRREAESSTHVPQPLGTIGPSNIKTKPQTRYLTHTEQAIARIWQQMLRLESIAPDDHFFSIGGDSLAAVQMLVDVEERFGLLLPIHLVFEAPTLEALALRIQEALQQQADEISTGFVFPLVAAGEGPPVFFSGVELSLAKRGIWDLPCPLYAIVNWVVGSGFVKASSLPELAAKHLAAIRRLQPQGPYRLAGYSLGGLIALEMAQQLRAAGEHVEMLFLLDSMAPERVQISANEVFSFRQLQSPQKPPPFPKNVYRYLRAVARGPTEKGAMEYVKTILQLPGLPIIRRPDFIGWYQYRMVNRHLRRPGKVSRLLFPQKRWRAFWFAAQRMVRDYVAAPYEDSVVAVFCQQGTRGEMWKSVLGPKACTYTLDAPHLALFEEEILKQWMAWLGEYLQNSRTTPSTTNQPGPQPAFNVVPPETRSGDE